MKRGHKSTQSDITKAYIQSDLKALVDDTYVELHTELVQSHLKHNHRPCARKKSLRKSGVGRSLVKQVQVRNGIARRKGVLIVSK